MKDIWDKFVNSQCFGSGEASPTSRHANANFSVFIERIRINFYRNG